MATSGSVESGTLKNSKFYVNWQVAKQDISNNYTVINWQAGLNVSNYDKWYTNAIRINNISIGGSTVFGGDTYSNITSNGNHELASGTTTIYHDNDGSKNINVYISGWLYSYGNTTGSTNFDLPSIPRQANVTGANNFNDEQNPYMTFNNAGGFALNVRLEFGGVGIQRNDIPNTGNYTFVLTEAEKELLLSKCTTSNSLSVRYVVATKLNGTESWWNWLDRTMTVVNANPTFKVSQLTYLDTNTNVVNITGNNQHIVRNNSNLKVTFTNATANKGASIIKYQISFNGSTQEKTAGCTIDYGTVNASQNLAVNVKAIDSRGNSSIISKTITFLDWVLPTAILTYKRLNNYEDATTIKASVNISSVNSKNSIKAIKYKYKKTTDSQYSSEVSINNNTEYSINFNKLHDWNIQFIIQDKFGTTTYNVVLIKGIPILFIDIKKLSIGLNKFPVNNNSIDLDVLNGKEVLDYDVIDEASKSIKIKNEKYWDSTSIVHNRQLLSNIINASNKNPIGEFTLWEGNKLITNDKSTFQQLGTCYWLKQSLLNKFALKDGFKRKTKLCVDYTDNFDGANHFLRFSRGTYIKEYVWEGIWGALGDGRYEIIQDFDFDNLPTGHITMSITPSWALDTDKSIRVYRIYLLVYDEIEV